MPSTDLRVSGKLPAALWGRFLQIGPSSAGGAATVEAVSLDAGRAMSHRNHRVPCSGNLVSFGTSVLVIGDGEVAYDLGADLETCQPVDLAGAGRALAAHSTVDPHTGELHLLTFATAPSQLHVTVSRGGLRRTIRPIEDAPNRVRQLEITPDDVVLLADGFIGLTRRTGVDTGTTWFEVDSDTRRIAAADSDGNAVTVYTIGPSLMRWTFPRRATTADGQVLDAEPHHFASCHRGPLGAPLRFLRTVGDGTAYKHDLLTGRRSGHHLGDRRHVGELVFVADPARSNVDDGGWLVWLVHDDARDQGDLVVLDAHAIERPAVATVHIPRGLPIGAHVLWIPQI